MTTAIRKKMTHQLMTPEEDTELLQLLQKREDKTEELKEINEDIVKEIGRLVNCCGWSFRRVGKKMGVSGQRVHQLYHSESTL
jgi:hypothetical protein